MASPIRVFPEVRGKTALVSLPGGKPRGCQHRAEGMKDLGHHPHGIGKFLAPEGRIIDSWMSRL